MPVCGAAASGAVAFCSRRASALISRPAGQRVPRRLVGALVDLAVSCAETTSGSASSEYGFGEQQQDPVHLEAGGVGAQLPFKPRLAELAGERRCDSRLSSPSSLSMHLEVVGVDRNVHGAGLALVHRQLALDRQRMLVLVEDLEPGHADPIGLELDPGRSGR